MAFSSFFYLFKVSCMHLFLLYAKEQSMVLNAFTKSMIQTDIKALVSLYELMIQTKRSLSGQVRSMKLVLSKFLEILVYKFPQYE